MHVCSTNAVGVDKENRCSDEICIYSYHGDMISQERRQHLEEYRGLNNSTKINHTADQDSTATVSRKQEKAKAAIMVCTDIAARGIDIPDVSSLSLAVLHLLSMACDSIMLF